MDNRQEYYQRCPNCGDLTTPDARLCPHCGDSHSLVHAVGTVVSVFFKTFVAISVGIAVGMSAVVFGVLCACTGVGTPAQVFAVLPAAASVLGLAAGVVTLVLLLYAGSSKGTKKK